MSSKELCSREQIANEYRWKLEDIIGSDDLWEEEYRSVLALLTEESGYAGKLAESEDALYRALSVCDELEEKIEKIYVYAFMRLYEDMSEPAAQAMAGKAQALSTMFSEKYAYMEPEILAIPEQQLAVWMTGKLKPYEHFINDIIAQRPHTLKSELEELLAGAGMMSSAPRDIFSQFNNSDIKFGNVKDENGVSVELTAGRYARFMENGVQSVRKEVFEKLYEQYKSHINTLAAIYDANVKQARFFAKARKYSSTMEMYLSGNFIPVSVYTQLIDTVNARLDLMHRYVGLRKKALGLDELHMYDVYAPMTSDYQMKVTYEEAKEIVIKGMAPLGERYTRLLREGFDNGWVDVYENRGKRSGAFSWGCYGSHPYVCLNYTDTLNDVFTLAHEMGHALHTYHSNAAQPHIYAGYRIFVAEVASTCNEALLIRYMLDNASSDEERMYLLNHYLEQFKGTLFRQTMFAEFEMKAHEASESGEVLSPQYLNSMYTELNRKYFGPDMVLDEEIAYEWSRIPHFYTPFYVYQYATGFSAAIAISSKILAGDRKAIDGYFEFLSGGSSLHPIDLLKLCGVDMSSGEPVEEALDVFENILDEMGKYVYR